MEKKITLEQELRARIFLHQTVITRTCLAQQYMKDNYSKGSINLPTKCLEERAEEQADLIIQKAMKEGTFNSLYEKAWENIKNYLPEYTKVI